MPSALWDNEFIKRLLGLDPSMNPDEALEQIRQRRHLVPRSEQDVVDEAVQHFRGQIAGPDGSVRDPQLDPRSFPQLEREVQPIHRAQELARQTRSREAIPQLDAEMERLQRELATRRHLGTRTTDAGPSARNPEAISQGIIQELQSGLGGTPQSPLIAMVNQMAGQRPSSANRYTPPQTVLPDLPGNRMNPAQVALRPGNVSQEMLKELQSRMQYGPRPAPAPEATLSGPANQRVLPPEWGSPILSMAERMAGVPDQLRGAANNLAEQYRRKVAPAVQAGSVEAARRGIEEQLRTSPRMQAARDLHERNMRNIQGNPATEKDLAEINRLVAQQRDPLRNYSLSTPSQRKLLRASNVQAREPERPKEKGFNALTVDQRMAILKGQVPEGVNPKEAEAMPQFGTYQIGSTRGSEPHMVAVEKGKRGGIALRGLQGYTDADRKNIATTRNANVADMRRRMQMRRSMDPSLARSQEERNQIIQLREQAIRRAMAQGHTPVLNKFRDHLPQQDGLGGKIASIRSALGPNASPELIKTVLEQEFQRSLVDEAQRNNPETVAGMANLASNPEAMRIHGLQNGIDPAAATSPVRRVPKDPLPAALPPRQPNPLVSQGVGPVAAQEDAVSRMARENEARRKQAELQRQMEEEERRRRVELMNAPLPLRIPGAASVPLHNPWMSMFQ